MYARHLGPSERWPRVESLTLGIDARPTVNPDSIPYCEQFELAGGRAPSKPIEAAPKNPSVRRPILRTVVTAEDVATREPAKTGTFAWPDRGRYAAFGHIPLEAERLAMQGYGVPLSPDATPFNAPDAREAAGIRLDQAFAAMRQAVLESDFDVTIRHSSWTDSSEVILSYHEDAAEGASLRPSFDALEDAMASLHDLSLYSGFSEAPATDARGYLADLDGFRLTGSRDMELAYDAILEAAGDTTSSADDEYPDADSLF